MLDNASGSGAHHCNLGKMAAETRRETDLALCRLLWFTDSPHRRPINAQLAVQAGSTETGSKSGLLRVRLLGASFLHTNSKFECRRAQLGRNPDDQPCRCLSADGRPVRDRARLHVSCLICGVRRAGWYLPSCARRRLAHCCGPGSLKLLPCRGNPFVDLVVTLLQIFAGAKRRWRRRPLDIRVEEGSSEEKAVLRVLLFQTSFTQKPASNILQ